MKKSIVFQILAALALLVSSCGGHTDVVDSGTYKGTVKEVEADKTEIYVTLEDNKTIELYFTETTTLTKAGKEVAFSELSEGKRVQVEVKKVGKRLDPIAVEILE